MELIRLFDLFGVAVFAISGALVAGRKQMDLFGLRLGAIRWHWGLPVFSWDDATRSGD